MKQFTDFYCDQKFAYCLLNIGKNNSRIMRIAERQIARGEKATAEEMSEKNYDLICGEAFGRRAEICASRRARYQ